MGPGKVKDPSTLAELIIFISKFPQKRQNYGLNCERARVHGEAKQSCTHAVGNRTAYVSVAGPILECNCLLCPGILDLE